MNRDKQIGEMAKLIQINYECPFSFAEGMAEFLHDEEGSVSIGLGCLPNRILRRRV